MFLRRLLSSSGPCSFKGVAHQNSPLFGLPATGQLRPSICSSRSGRAKPRFRRLAGCKPYTLELATSNGSPAKQGLAFDVMMAVVPLLHLNPVENHGAMEPTRGIVPSGKWSKAKNTPQAPWQRGEGKWGSARLHLTCYW